MRGQQLSAGARRLNRHLQSVEGGTQEPVFCGLLEYYPGRQFVPPFRRGEFATTRTFDISHIMIPPGKTEITAFVIHNGTKYPADLARFPGDISVELEYGLSAICNGWKTEQAFGDIDGYQISSRRYLPLVHYTPHQGYQPCIVSDFPLSREAFYPSNLKAAANLEQYTEGTAQWQAGWDGKPKMVIKVDPIFKPLTYSLKAIMIYTVLPSGSYSQTDKPEAYLSVKTTL